MKKRRLQAILTLIKEHAVSTQEELLELLQRDGFDVTQATVSRDIKELRLIKTTDASGVYRYKQLEDGQAAAPKFAGIFADSVISVVSAVNDVVVRCYAGMANAACASLDGMAEMEGIVGTLAGDDTIFVLMRSEEAAAHLVRRIEQMISLGE